jgi:hypothetical protein
VCIGPVDEDEQGEHVSRKHCSKSSPKFSGQKKNDGQVKYTFFNPPWTFVTYEGIVNAATLE